MRPQSLQRPSLPKVISPPLPTTTTTTTTTQAPKTEQTSVTSVQSTTTGKSFKLSKDYHSNDPKINVLHDRDKLFMMTHTLS